METPNSAYDSQPSDHRAQNTMLASAAEPPVDATPSINHTLKDLQKKEKLYQTGKAYLEKKIYEYESRLNNMKTKKERSS